MGLQWGFGYWSGAGGAKHQGGDWRVLDFMSLPDWVPVKL